MLSAPAARLPAMLLPPRALVDRVRWLFLVLTLAMSLPLAAMLVFAETVPPPARAAGLLLLLAMCVRWICRYRRPAQHSAWDVAESLALVAVSAGVGEPRQALGLVYLAICYRSMFCTPRGAAPPAAMYTGVYLAAVALAARYSGGTVSVTGLAQRLLEVVTMVPDALMVAVLVQTLARHERAAARERTLAAISARLVAAQSPAEAYAISADGAIAIAGAAAGVCAAVWLGTPDALRPVATDGGDSRAASAAALDLADVPDAPRAELRAGRAVDGRRLGWPVAVPIEQTLGIDCAGGLSGLLVVPLLMRGELRGILALGADALPPDCTDALETLGSVVALALEGIDKSEARFRALVQNASDLVSIVSEAGEILYESPAAQRLFGYRPGENLGRSLADLIHPDDVPRMAKTFRAIATRPGASAAIEGRIRHHDGSWRYVEATSTNLLHEPRIQGIVLNTRDVTERRLLEERLRYQAFHDPLTRLANAALFRDRLAEALRRAERSRTPVATLFVDLDDFKTINDSLGHAAGDELLINVASRLQATLRQSDTIARLGGDEFAVLLEGAPETEVVAAADRIMQALRPPLSLQGREVFVHASVGIATNADGEAGVDELLRDADAAMYSAKARGKGQYEHFQPSLHAAVLNRLELAADLQRAVERDEFVVHYQPIVELATGEIAGVEALVRWQHPTRGLVPPLDFVPLAEETGLIVPIGSGVLRQACRQAGAWNRARGSRAPLSVSVNLSAKQLQSAGTVEVVAAALQQSGLEPERLVLEITESVLMREVDATLRTLGDLKALCCWRSTTSAPATPRSATCGASRSTRSRWTSRSSTGWTNQGATAVCWPARSCAWRNRCASRRLRKESSRSGSGLSYRP